MILTTSDGEVIGGLPTPLSTPFPIPPSHNETLLLG